MDGWMDGWMDEGREGGDDGWMKAGREGTEGREAQPAHQRQQQLWLRFVGVDSPSLWASKGQSQIATRQRGGGDDGPRVLV